MSDRAFFDTNIFLYAHDGNNLSKQTTARELIFRKYRAGTCAISTQVLAEFFQNYVVKFGNSYINAIKEMHFMTRCPVIEQTISLVISGVSIFSKHSISFWDSMIIAAAKEAAAETLYTDDMQHGQEIEGIRITNPFLYMSNPS